MNPPTHPSHTLKIWPLRCKRCASRRLSPHFPHLYSFPSRQVEVDKEVAALVDKVSDEAGQLVYGAGRLLGGVVARVKVAVREGEEGLSGGVRGAGEAGGALLKQISEVVKVVAEVPMDVARGVGGGVRALPLTGHEKHQEVIKGRRISLSGGNVAPMPDGPKLYRAITPKEGGGVADGADPETWDWGELEEEGATYKVAG